MADAPYTLTQVSQLTGISMPTLQRYKKLYQDRIPSIGDGRTQRYPEKALAEFRKIKKENLKKRGRPKKSAAEGSSSNAAEKGQRGRKKAAAKKRKKGPSKGPGKGSGRGAAKKVARRKTAVKRGRAKADAGGGENLLTLSEVGRRTGISYPTLLRYVKLYLDQIPHKGEGRKRRYEPEAVAVFQSLRASSRRGRRKGSGAKKAAAKSPQASASASRLLALERSQARLEKKVDRLIKKLSKPLL